MVIPQVGILEIRDEVVASATFGGIVNAQAVEAHNVGVVDAAKE